MKNIFRSPVLLIAGIGVACDAQPQRQPEEGFKLLAGVQHQMDDNFSRLANVSKSERSAVEEQITRASIGTIFDKTLSAQQIGLRFSANQFTYAEREELNETSWEGNASWRSRFGRNASSLLRYVRTETPVDQLEFRGRDLIARENTNAQFTWGESRRVSVTVGAHQFDQSHSNETRQYLDFKDRDASTEIRYKSLASSWVSLRYRKGDRDYEFVELLPRDLNFDYQQWEIETHWVITPKTELTGITGYFEREGATNNDEGALAGLKFSWQATSKLATDIVYSFNRPAQGESSDSPVEVSAISFMLRWQWTSKLQIGAGANYSDFEYLYPDSAESYFEKNISVTPLSLEWAYSDAIRLRLATLWMERSSPMLDGSPIGNRNYDTRVITGGLALAF